MLFRNQIKEKKSKVKGNWASKSKWSIDEHEEGTTVKGNLRF